jgi:hypothetical protein
VLKRIYALSDEGVCDRWVHDPYFQYFTGEDLASTRFGHRVVPADTCKTASAVLLASRFYVAGSDRTRGAFADLSQA